MYVFNSQDIINTVVWIVQNPSAEIIHATSLTSSAHPNFGPLLFGGTTPGPLFFQPEKASLSSSIAIRMKEVMRTKTQSRVDSFMAEQITNATNTYNLGGRSVVHFISAKL